MLRDLVEELHPHSKGRIAVDLDSRLDRDLGLDSLTRMELLARLERRWEASLPASAVAEADTPRDLLRVLRGAGGEAATIRSEPDAPLRAMPGQVPPSGTTTLVEALKWHAARHPDRVHVHLLDESGGSAQLTYGALYEGARRVAGGLQRRGLAPGESVAIMLPTGLEYLQAFFGVLLAGGVPVPIYPPARMSQLEDHLRRHARILDNARARRLVTFRPALAVSRLLSAQIEAVHGVLDVDDLVRSSLPEREWSPASADVALLQYTSGSTGSPKGVVLTHADLLASLDAMHQALEIDGEDIFVSWLPLYHDMGLIGAWLGSLYYAMPLVLMSPLVFLARPVRWLEAIHHYRATLSGGPNFAYEMCRRRISDAELEGLDLGSWRVAFNGAEPVSPETQEGFAARLAHRGFDPRALTPVYGLAEAALGVAFTPVGRGPRYDRVERESMQRNGFAKVAEAPGAARCEIRGDRFSDSGFRSAHRRRWRKGDGGAQGGAYPVSRSVHHVGLPPQPRGLAAPLRRRLAGVRRPRLRRGRRALHHRPRQGPHHPGRTQRLSLRARTGGGRGRGRSAGLRGGVRVRGPGVRHRAAGGGRRDPGERARRRGRRSPRPSRMPRSGISGRLPTRSGWFRPTRC